MSNTTDKMLDRYVYLHLEPTQLEGRTGVTIHVKLDDEGVVVDAWQHDDEWGDEVIASTYKLYNDMGVEVKEVEDD